MAAADSTSPATTISSAANLVVSANLALKSNKPTVTSLASPMIMVEPAVLAPMSTSLKPALKADKSRMPRAKKPVLPAVDWSRPYSD